VECGGNIATTDTSTVTASVNPNVGTVANNTKVAVAGVATFNGLTLSEVAGVYTLTFSDEALTTAVSSSITIGVGTAQGALSVTSTSAV